MNTPAYICIDDINHTIKRIQGYPFCRGYPCYFLKSTHHASFSLFIISACMLFTSCNKDEVITEEVGGQPIIELDSETGIYTVKVDHELTIAPTYQNVEDASFAWTIDGTLVSSGPSLQRTWNECGDFYVKLRVDNAEGYAEEELKVEVKELTPPVISLAYLRRG